MKKRRVEVMVTAHFDTEGNMKPMSIVWPDGRCFAIDAVVDKRKAASHIAGGQGMRYTVQISGKPRYLFFDLSDKVWFVEALGAE